MTGSGYAPNYASAHLLVVALLSITAGNTIIYTSSSELAHDSSLGLAERGEFPLEAAVRHRVGCAFAIAHDSSLTFAIQAEDRAGKHVTVFQRTSLQIPQYASAAGTVNSDGAGERAGLRGS